jgi:hypothetical protein
MSLELLANKLNPEFVKDKVLRAVVTGIFPVVKVRVHKEGKGSDGSPIGTYTPEYMKVRTGKWKYKGRNLNRTGDNKVIISLTRQMENDMTAVIQSNLYAIGYKNNINRKKVDWVTDTYGKDIFALTSAELKLTSTIAAESLKKYLSNG